MKPVVAYTFKGKLLLVVIRAALAVLHLFVKKKWNSPVRKFHEDPFHYSFTDILYFAYKYYYQPPECYDDGSTNAKFNTQLKAVEDNEVLSKITLSAGGDLMPYEWIKKEYCVNLWDDIGSSFFGSDIVMANLETPIDITEVPGYVPELMLNDMEFNGSAEMFEVFNGNQHYKGFDVLSIANNHSFDKGVKGIKQTINFLETKNIKHCGNADSLEKIHDFPIIEKNGIKIAFIGFTYSLNHLQLPESERYLCNHIELNQEQVDLGFITKQVAIAHERGAALVIGSAHFGNAYQLFPSDHIIKNTHRLFEECGLDMVIGNHGHNLQPVEVYEFQCPHTGKLKQGFAAYCLGDFVAYDIFTWGHLPVWLKIEIVKTKDGVKVNEVKINPIYTMGIYHNKDKRNLKFFDAKKLWSQLENKTQTTLPPFHQKEALYLKQTFQKVFPE